MHALFVKQILNVMMMLMAAMLLYLRMISGEGLIIIPAKVAIPVMGILIVMGIVTARMWQSSKKTLAAILSTTHALHVMWVIGVSISNLRKTIIMKHVLI
jgi:hypothetical protein